MNLERRVIALGSVEVRTQNNRNTLVGICSPYGKLSNELRCASGVFVECIERGAFDDAIKSNDIYALVAHDDQKILGRNTSGTLRLSSVAEGLRYEVDLPNCSYANDLRESVDRGDVTGCSFGFRVPKGGDRWTFEKRPALRTLLKIDLREISLGVKDPAYPDGTFTQLRSTSSAFHSAFAAHSKRLFCFFSTRRPPSGVSR